MNRFHIYKTAGLLGGGLASFIILNHHYSRPARLRYPLQFLVGVASFPIIYFLSTYFGFYNRKGSNTLVSNLYTNNLWRRNRE
jgi:hypothetical protein